MLKAVTSGAETPVIGATKTPQVLKLPLEEGNLKEEYSPGTCTDFETFLQQRKACTLFDDAAQLAKTHPSVIHQSITSSAWVLNTPILNYSVHTWLEWD